MIKNNYYNILEKIDKIKKANSIDYNVQVMAVSKTKPVEDIIEALSCGIKLYGENRVLEAYEKFNDPRVSSEGYELHIIGHLQRNKIKKAIEIASCVQSIDKIETLELIEKYADAASKKIDYLIEINTSREEQKSGIAPKEIDTFLDIIQKKSFKNCNLRGVMTVGPLTNQDDVIRKSFRELKELFEKYKSQLKMAQFDIISMGMSQDYLIAVEEGSNLVRIGSNIFGRRF